MRFNNEDYLKAFPREEKSAPTAKQIVNDEPGSVIDEPAEENKGSDQDPEPEGGVADGDE